MPGFPIFTDQAHLDAEKDAANEFLKLKGLPLIEKIEFVDEDDSYLSINNGKYYIDYRNETVMHRNLRGEFPVEVPYLCAYYVEDPMDPEDCGGRMELYEESHFGSLSFFMVRLALEHVYQEWRNFNVHRAYVG